MITNYIVEKREDKEDTEWELVSSSINGTSCRVPNLVESAGYFFRVYAQNRYGNSEPLETTSPILIKSQLGKCGYSKYIHGSNGSHSKKVTDLCVMSFLYSVVMGKKPKGITEI